MNERIKELARQAGAYWNHGDFNMGSSIEFQEGDLEKFAELIVRECAKVSERTGSLNEADFEGEMIADAIKEHFGVQE